MNKVAANTTDATGARWQYVYKQRVRASLVRTTGPIRRKETREYTVVPQNVTTDKTLASFSGEYRDGRQMVPYSQLGVKDKGDQGDRELIQELIEALVHAKNARDGVPGEAEVRGRHTYDIVFEPVEIRDLCIHVGGDEENPCHQWKGEIRKFGGARLCSRRRWRPARATPRSWARRFGRSLSPERGSCGIQWGLMRSRSWLGADRSTMRGGSNGVRRTTYGGL
jgi:hypothetical protein